MKTAQHDHQMFTHHITKLLSSFTFIFMQDMHRSENSGTEITITALIFQMTKSLFVTIIPRRQKKKEQNEINYTHEKNV